MYKAITTGIAAAILLGGCAAQQETRSSWAQQEEKFAAIKPNATKDEVTRLVGKPQYAMVFPNLGEEVWDYRYMSGVVPFVTEVHFDMQGRTKNTSAHPDKCRLSPVACY